MKHYALVIKATSKEEARQAAREHGIILGITDKHPRYDEVIASAGVRRITVLQDWYRETRGKAPFPVGTLLTFSEIKKVPRRKVDVSAEA